MRRADLSDDGEAQTGATGLHIQALKALEDLYPGIGRNAGTIVLDLQNRWCQYPHHDIAAWLAVSQGIFHQVAEQLVEQRGLANHPCLGKGLEGQGDALGMGQRCQRHGQFPRQLTEFQPLGTALGDGLGPALDPCQRQQLVGQTRQAVGAGAGLFQGGVPGVGFPLAQAKLDPGLDRRQRGAQFMGGVGDEIGLALEQSAQAQGKAFQGMYQGQ